jgi:hypothetical protein
MDEDFRQLDDPALLAEAERMRAAVAALAEKYRALREEYARRAGARWTA